MSNDEIQRVMDFIIEWQEAFSQNLVALTEPVTHLSAVVGEVVDAQQSFLRSQERMQNDISNMLKITTGLFEIVVKVGAASGEFRLSANTSYE